MLKRAAAASPAPTSAHFVNINAHFVNINAERISVLTDELINAKSTAV
jgi:hypothetical protein